ncbi:5'-methylthioadenosine/S-adenosylhomocysteine nucleosidase family protein [Kineosporia succinea]|uniref:Nucleoside phosphorylase n=1 Tax=Kineosporia succinea TaxID=84632 RepID=A0ABT9PA37_9ACTN|nr:hypothetical protein [Kineosporia succinea]MDP9829554.1 nucleoside phosphorylase [Kineosporia succinea]
MSLDIQTPQPVSPLAHPGPGEATLAILTALPEEFITTRLLLDEEWRAVTVPGDPGDYVLGSISSTRGRNSAGTTRHHVVLTLLTETGNDAAASSCAHLLRSFPTVTCVAMSGIAAGVPAPHAPARHVRLGDVVAGTWGVVDYDHVYDSDAGSTLRQPFPRPSTRLLRGAKVLAGGELIGDRPWEGILDRIIERGGPAFARPEPESDVLHSRSGLRIAHPALLESGHRPGRPKVHQGRIGSGDRALRSAARRDQLATRHDLRALEMEGKGMGDAAFSAGREWFVVRGISDYGDRHTSLRWRNYAAAASAAYLGALLSAVPTTPAR